MRHGGGNRDNPLVFEFMSEYRKVSIESIFAKVCGSNCSTDAGDFLIKLNQFQSLVHVPTNKCTLFYFSLLLHQLYPLMNQYSFSKFTISCINSPFLSPIYLIRI